jgi:hypothetical protein
VKVNLTQVEQHRVVINAQDTVGGKKKEKEAHQASSQIKRQIAKRVKYG